MSIQRLSVLLLFLSIFYTLPAVYSYDSIPAEKSDRSDLYIEDLTELFTLRLYTLTKFNSLEVINPAGKMIMRPNGNTNFGIGFNYTFLGFGIAFGRPLSAENIRKYGLTNRFDLQASLYSRRVGMDGFLQWYQGYYMVNPQDFITWEKDNQPQVRDLQVFSLGGNVFYLFNGRTFSYKAAYLRNEIQKKSAGSFSTGIFFYHDMVRSEQGFLPAEMPDSIHQDFDLKAFDATSIGFSVGYTHTFVIKGNFFIHFQLSPGVGYRRLASQDLSGVGGIVNKFDWQVYGRSAMGYNFRNHYYIGLMGSIILRSFQDKGYEVDLGTEQFRFMVGKRFDLGR